MYPLRRFTCAWTRVRLYAGRPVVAPLLYPPSASSRDMLSVDLRGHVTTVSGLTRVPIRPLYLSDLARPSLSFMWWGSRGDGVRRLGFSPKHS